MKKIVIDARCIFDSGIGIYVREVLSRFIKLNDFSVEVILLSEQIENFTKLNINVNKIHQVNFGRYSVKNIFGLNKLLSNAEVYLMPALSLSPVLSSVKKVVVVHDLCPISLRKFFGNITAIAYFLFMGIQVLSSKRIICISEFTKNELLSYFSTYFKFKVTVIYNGLSTRLNCHGIEQNTKQLGKPYLLCVGNIKPHKNVINLVNFFINNSRYSESHILVIVGKSDGFRTGINLTQELNENVRFTGFVSDDDLASLYNNAAAYIFPSFYEGFGLPILEAMSFNLPILASNIPVFKEIAGQDIMYFDQNTFVDFDVKLTELLKASPKDYSQTLAFFTWENSVKKMVDVINK